MNDQTQPYETVKPGDLLTAELFNQVQTDIKQDIAKQISDAVKDIPTVKQAEKAGDADKLDSKTLDQITQEITDQVLKKIPERTGYKIIFLRLQSGTDKQSDVHQMKVVEHGLYMPPQVDVYQLNYFRVVCATGDTAADRYDAWVNFYLFNTREPEIRFQPAGSPTTPTITIEIEPAVVYPSPLNQPIQPSAKYPRPHKILFSEMLKLYKVKYEDTTTLDDLETDFWTAFFAPPNDEFDRDQYCHSPWFEKCCGEQRSVRDLKQRGDWDDIWFLMEPFKTINYPFATTGAAGTIVPNSPFQTPTQIQVTHFDFNTLGIGLLGDPVYPPEPLNKDEKSDPNNPKYNRKELKVMLLLKV
jgi:hypothetical protein